MARLSTELTPLKDTSSETSPSFAAGAIPEKEHAQRQNIECSQSSSTITVDELTSFEAEIAECFSQGQIKAPVHLAGGNEKQLIEIFKDVEARDWVVVQWRSHFHCLLKGVPREVLKRDILAGRSITLAYPEQRVISSAIAGGHLSIAVGLACAAKRNRSGERVWAFCGDMVARSGAFHEATQYAEGNGLPMTFVIEDNGLSVMTDTRRAWGERTELVDVRTYSYELQWPHSGIGKRVEF